jgi:hypothetical protein
MIFVVALFIDITHEGVAFEDVASLDKEEKCIFLGHLDALADDVRKFVGSQVIRY